MQASTISTRIYMDGNTPIVVDQFQDGSCVSRPLDEQIHVQWKHVDGPLMHCRDGTLHWLTWSERFQLWVGWTTLEEIEKKRCRVDLRELLAAALLQHLAKPRP